MLKVAASEVVPDLRQARRIQIYDEPVYDTFSAGDDDDGDSESEVRVHREMRESVCAFSIVFQVEITNLGFQDDPNRQWAEDHLDMYLGEALRLEGRGDHMECDACTRCSVGNADHRCVDCLGGGELLCSSCIVEGHRQLPFHGIEVSRATR
jgi:hypothetical protein